MSRSDAAGGSHSAPEHRTSEVWVPTAVAPCQLHEGREEMKRQTEHSAEERDPGVNREESISGQSCRRTCCTHHLVLEPQEVREAEVALPEEQRGVAFLQVSACQPDQSPDLGTGGQRARGSPDSLPGPAGLALSSQWAWGSGSCRGKKSTQRRSFWKASGCSGLPVSLVQGHGLGQSASSKTNHYRVGGWATCSLRHHYYDSKIYVKILHLTLPCTEATN